MKEFSLEPADCKGTYVLLLLLQLALVWQLEAVTMLLIGDKID